MTRKENSGYRDLTFNNWVRENLPDSSTGFMVSDIDFFMYNYKTKRCLFLETKTHSARIKNWQKMMYKMLTLWVKNGMEKDWTFYGFHVLTFENTDFSNGNAYLDGKLVSERQLISFLSME